MSGSDKKCCVPKCVASRGSCEVLHTFPNPDKDKERFHLWIKNINGSLINMDSEHIFKYRRVCRAHFEEKFLCRYNRISNIAVPTLNIPGYDESSGTNKVEEASKIERLQIEQAPATSNFTGRRPLTQIQNILEMPTTSTSKGLAEVENILPVVCDTKNNETLPAYLPIPHEAIKIDTGCQKEKTTIKRPRVTRHGKRLIVTTLAEQNMYNKLVKMRMKLSKYKNKVKKQSAAIKLAKNVVANPTFVKIMESLPTAAKMLTLMQCRESQKKDKGRRFSLDEKLLALSIFKQSPKSYRFLRKLLILPAPQTLIKVLSEANIKPGLNKKIFQQLHKKAETMTVEKKLCILLFDEMSLKAHVAYNERKDRVVGFVTDGDETKSDFADHAQVFMIRGLMKNYKQPVSYTFSLAATKGPELANQIKTLIKEIQKTGLIVVATVCDQGTNNRQAIKMLLQETRSAFLRKEEVPKDNIIVINDQEIVPLYDPPHLLKCIRNNLLTKDLNYTINNVNGTAKWSHLELLLKENPGYKGIRLIPKLTECHVIASKIPKMKVKYASQIFSRAVANNMGYLADKNILPTECKETADLLLFFDDLFDSMNGSFKKREKHGKPLLGAVKGNSIHHEKWNEAKKALKSMKFINRKNGKMEAVPTLNNWAWTLEGVQLLLKNLSTKYGITSIWMRHLNQDPIENFFGVIRSHGCRNNNPTPQSFESAYTALLINNMTGVHAPGGNCEKDLCKTLHALVITEDCKDATTCDFNNMPEIVISPYEQKSDPRVVGPLHYVSGYFVVKMKKNIFKACNQCKNDLINENEFEYIKYREYAGRRWLCSPSKAMIECISNIQDIYDAILKKNLTLVNIKCFIKTVLIMLIDFDFIKCVDHKDDLINFLIKLSSRFFIHNYCKNLNKILNGLKDCDDDEDNFQIKAKKHFQCIKRKRI